MRIELNSGGLSGLIAISSFADSIEKLDDNIEAMISTFQEVKKAVGKLKGGVGTLSGAVDSLQRRIEQEQTKRNNLADFGKSFDDFLDLAVSIDDQAANLVNKNKDEFYQLNPHLRPELTVSEKLAEFVDNIGEALDKLGELIKEHIDEFLVGFVAVAAVVGGIVLIVITGGAVIAVIAGMALIGAGVGTAVAWWKSAKDDDDVDLLEAGKGFVLGFVAGAAVGACLYGVSYIATTFKGAGAFFGGNALQGGAAMSVEFFQQTVVEGESVGFDRFNGWDILKEGGKAFLIASVMGGIFKLSGLEKAITGFTQNKLSNIIKFQGVKFDILSRTPANVIKGFAETIAEIGFDFYTGDLKEGFGLGDAMMMWFQNVFFSTVSDSVEVKIEHARRSKLLPVTVKDVDDSFTFTNKTLDTEVDTRFNNLTADVEEFKSPDVDDSFTFTNKTLDTEVDTRFNNLTADVEELKAPYDLFDDNYPEITRTASIKELYSDPNTTIRSHDLSKPTYNKDNNLLNTLRKDLRQTTGNTLRVVVPNGDLSIPQIAAFNKIHLEAKELNIKLIVSPQISGISLSK